MGMFSEKWRRVKNWFRGPPPKTKTKTKAQPQKQKTSPNKSAPRTESLYSPLGDKEIRLVRLLPGNDHSVLRLEFLPHASLDFLPPYHALSYSWGNPSITKPITIITVNKNTGRKEAVEFQGTVNLVYFLYYHRRTLGNDSGSGVLWVDAICINQNDVPERNKQVLLMRQVYEKAASTIVWLGVERKEFEKGLLLIERAPKTPVSGALNRGNYDYAEMLVDMNPWLEDEENVALVKDCYSSFLHLLTLPWFSRIWVKQEYIVSEIVTLQYGNRHLSLSDLYPVGAMLPNARKFTAILKEIVRKEPLVYMRLLSLHSTMSQIQVLDRGRRTYSPGNGSIYPLLHFLCLLRDNQATNSVDKVYALLGLPTTKTTSTTASSRNESLGYDPQLLIIDYKAPVHEVYKSLAQSVILATRKVDIIRACQDGGMNDLPTWVPDWSKAWTILATSFLQHQINLSQPEARYYWNEGGTGTDFTASKTTDAITSFSSDLKLLRVKGLVVDTIDQLFGRFNSNPKTANTYGNNVLAWRKRGVWGVYGNEEKAKEAHWESLVALSNLKVKGRGTELSNAIRGGVAKREPTLEAWEVEYEDMVVNSGFNKEFVIMCNVTMNGRQTMVGEKGYFVTGPGKAEVGDLVVVLLGCDVPVLLRRVGDEVRFAGECYCHGVMKGEMMEALDAGIADSVEFELC